MAETACTSGAGLAAGIGIDTQFHALGVYIICQCLNT